MKLLQKKILVPICILLVTIVISTVWYSWFENKYQNYQSITAVVTKYWVTYGRSKVGGGRMYHWKYKYWVNGEEYFGEDKYSGNSGESNNIGDSITVWYNPVKPDESTMNTDASMNFIAPFFLAFPLMVGSYAIFSNREKKSKLL